MISESGEDVLSQDTDSVLYHLVTVMGFFPHHPVLLSS
jgi:hypothetical protein